MLYLANMFTDGARMLLDLLIKEDKPTAICLKQKKTHQGRQNLLDYYMVLFLLEKTTILNTIRLFFTHLIDVGNNSRIYTKYTDPAHIMKNRPVVINKVTATASPSEKEKGLYPE